ncbi:MAG: MFS transporter [Bacteroidales bacterium]|nr:MFS transporter [Bacteroidales bacterium]MDD4669834.1 MFS transporter [Bacteroidales bacterium]
MTTTKKSNYALPIAMMFALFFMISFVTGLQNPFGVIVKDQFSASNFLSQLGNLANFIAYACMGIPAGIMLKRLGYKKTALWAIIVGFVGVGITLLSGIAESFAVYLVGAFVSGFSMCMLNTVVNPMLNSLGKNEKQGNQLIQFGGACNSIGATIVPVLIGYLMGSNVEANQIADANPALFIAMGIFALAFIVLSLTRIPEPHLALSSQKSAQKETHSAWSFRHFIFGIITIFIYVGVEVGIPNIANLYMTEDLGAGGLEMDEAIAGTLCGTYWFLMFIGRLVGGLIGGKVSSKVMLSATTAIGALFVLLAMFINPSATVNMPVFNSNLSFGLQNVPTSIMFLILCGLCTSVMWGSIFNLATSGLGRFTEMASGIFMMMVCGGGILPIIQGRIADSAGFLNSYWLIFAGFIFMMMYALVFSKNVNKDIVTE